MALILRALVAVAVAYLAIIIILWTLQSRFIYPAPQQVVPLTPGYAEVQLQTKDGLTLRAFYRAAAEGQRTVVYFHGNGGSLAGASVANAALVDRGIGALLVEYRGYGGNPGEPSEEALYKDGAAAMAWLTGQGIAPEQTVIIGNSIGSGVATEMAVRHDAAGLILVSPFTSLPDATGDNLWWLPGRLLVRDQYSSKDKIKDLAIPILVQHGTADTLIPHAHGQTMAELAPNGEFQSFVGEGHALSFIRSSGEARADWILTLGPAR